MTIPPDIGDAMQSAILRVVLSLDSFVLNGILYGVLSQPVPGFLGKVADNVRRELAALDEPLSTLSEARRAPAEVRAASMRAAFQRLIDHVASLIPFRSLPLSEVAARVARIAPLREDCLHTFAELEACLPTEPATSEALPRRGLASVNTFLADLEQVFVFEWSAANESSTPRR